MPHTFTITVRWKNQEHHFSAELQVSGYTYKIIVMVYNHPITFEPDEERNFRAILYGEQTSSPPDAGLLQAIAAELEEALK